MRCGAAVVVVGGGGLLVVVVAVVVVVVVAAGVSSGEQATRFESHVWRQTIRPNSHQGFLQYPRRERSKTALIPMISICAPHKCCSEGSMGLSL